MCLGIDRDDGGHRGAWVEGTPGAPLYSGPLPLGDGAVFGGVRGCQVCRSGSRPASPLLSPCGKVTKRVGRETSPTCDFKTAACPEAGRGTYTRWFWPLLGACGLRCTWGCCSWELWGAPRSPCEGIGDGKPLVQKQVSQVECARYLVAVSLGECPFVMGG